MDFEKKLLQGVAKSETVENAEKQKKLARIEQIKKDVEKIADYEGKGLDRGVKELIASFMVMDVPTSASCEGHTSTGSRLAPWVEIGDIEEPDERFVDENKIFQKVADERSLSFEEVKRSGVQDAYWDAMKRMSQNEETQAYQEWEIKNKKLLEETKKLIDEFYQQKGEPKNPLARIEIDDDFGRIFSGGEDYAILESELNGEEKNLKEKKMEEYRAEFKRFADFLLEKYLQE